MPGQITSLRTQCAEGELRPDFDWSGRSKQKVVERESDNGSQYHFKNDSYYRFLHMRYRSK